MVVSSKKNCFGIVNLNEKIKPEIGKNFVSETRKNNCDIVLFPEFAFVQQYDESEVVTIGDVPCNHSSNNPILHELSCAALNNHIFVIVDLLEHGEDCHKGEDLCEFGYYLYNTLVVFDRSGTVIKKYRKEHPFIRDYIKPGDLDQRVIFNSDFGFNASFLICFDMLFTHPVEEMVKLGIKNFIFLTYWIDRIPLSSLQVQRAFSLFFDINLYGSGMNMESEGAGTFFKGKPILIPELGKTQIQFVEIPKERNKKEIKPKRAIEKIDINESFEYEKFLALKGAEISKTFSLKTFECRISLKVKEGANDWFIVYAEENHQIQESVLVSFCGIINCGKNVSLCEDHMFINNESFTFLDDVNIEMEYYSSLPNVMFPLEGTNDKKLFNPVTQFSFKKDDKTFIEKGKNIIEPTLFVVLGGFTNN